MRLHRRVLFAAVFVVAAAPHALARTDMSKVTCGAFLASGQANMAVIIMWLRGYHAGKRGVIDVIEKPPADPYGGRLGRYCKDHPNDSVIDASERILSDLDRGI
jgi:acid stress chaperone HdeB